MATVLIAIGDVSLREAARSQLEAAGHAPVLLQRPLASLSLARRLRWDAVCLDDSVLGRETLATLADLDGDPCRLIGVGFEAAALTATIPLPLAEQALLRAVSGVSSADGSASAADETLRLDPATRLVRSRGREVALTRTEFRLLETLLERQPQEVALTDLLQAVWGYTEGRGTSDLIRAHIRNLRTKLASIGLPDTVRSRRGHGYALVI